MVSLEEQKLREKLASYSQPNVFFLKQQWRDLIAQKKYDSIQKEKGASLQVIYDMFDNSKIISIGPAEHGSGRYKVKLKHSKYFIIYVIIKFDCPKPGDLGVVTYVKCKTKQK